MANTWTATRQTGSQGWIQIVMQMPGGQPVDVTYFRDTPTELQNFTSADPFGDATAVINFPQITVMDDPYSQDLRDWFGLFANVDIFWVPGFKQASPPNPNRTGWTTTSMNAGSYKAWIDPYTESTDMVAPSTFVGTVSKSGTSTPNTIVDARIKLWEGFVTNIDFTGDDKSNSANLECQGALYQADRYLMKPFYPPNPWPIETLIKSVFEHRRHPHLRTGPAYIQWPTGWSLTIPKRGDTIVVGGVTIDNTAYPIEGRPGKNWSGFATRQTGSWERCLTGYIQDNLALMLVPGQAGDTVSVKGSQWTLMQKRSAQGGYSPGRQPYLTVRDRLRTPDFQVWVNQPGVTMSLTRDGTQMANLVYGDGVGIDGTVWRNELISKDGSYTDYQPLAFSREVYPYTHNRAFNKHLMAMESYMSFGSGINEDQAMTSAGQHLQRELDPGYTGTITLNADVLDMSNAIYMRWQIHAGMTVLVKGLEGRTDGIRFHIPQVDASPQDGTVTLTVDTKYRDLLTVNEVRARTRDPLTPTRLLQTNKNSVVIEDRNAPWSYRRGSGLIGGSSVKKWWHSKPNSYYFPYRNWFTLHPPAAHKGHSADFYVTCHAGADDPRDRVAKVPIIMSERGTIRRTEIFCIDKNGNLLGIPFHFSLYYVNSINQRDLPRNNTKPVYPDPYVNNGFTMIDPVTGLQQSSIDNHLTNENNLIIMWGGQWNGIMNRAGFYPGSEASGNSPTGILVDDSPWTFDFTTGNNNYPKSPTTNKLSGKAANHPTIDNITAYGLFYADTNSLADTHPAKYEKVYFLGRFIREEPGQG